MKLKVTVSSENGGEVQVDGISIISPFEKMYTSNQNVLLKAIPASGYYFSGWQEGDNVKDIIDTAETITISMSCPKNIKAVFTSNAYQLNIDIQPSGGGQISISPSQPGNIYPSGMKVTINAVANEGYQFSKWTGDVSTDNSSCELIMDGNRNIIANFVSKDSFSASSWGRTIGIGLGIALFIGVFVFLIIRIISLKKNIS